MKPPIRSGSEKSWRKKEELDQQRRRLAEIRDAVRKDADNRKQLLASLRQEKESRVLALRELEQAALRLHRMTEEMSRRAVRKPSDQYFGTGLETMKGNLEWPVSRDALPVASAKAPAVSFLLKSFAKALTLRLQSAR